MMTENGFSRKQSEQLETQINNAHRILEACITPKAQRISYNYMIALAGQRSLNEVARWDAEKLQRCRS